MLNNIDFNRKGGFYVTNYNLIPFCRLFLSTWTRIYWTNERTENSP